MPYWIEYYSHDKKVGDALAPFSIADAMKAAKRGLVRRQAQYARIVDPDRAGKVVGLVHRDTQL